MPIPPDYGEPKRETQPIRIKPPDGWVFLLLTGVICVGVSGGDLNNVGQQLTGASLAAFRFIVKAKHDDDD